MLSRYRMIRGKRAPDDPLPKGIRMDTRKHTHHLLRPGAASVEAVLRDGSDAAFRRFARDYTAGLEARFAKNRAGFDELAETARHADLYLGCSCPSKANPDVRQCHTALALKFMKKKYPDLRVVSPA
ncbi:MAG TPA: hypothetical protein VF395_16425 [Polyangiaceae bacterium]